MTVNQNQNKNYSFGYLELIKFGLLSGLVFGLLYYLLVDDTFNYDRQ